MSTCIISISKKYQFTVLYPIFQVMTLLFMKATDTKCVLVLVHDAKFVNNKKKT